MSCIARTYDVKDFSARRFLSGSDATSAEAFLPTEPAIRTYVNNKKTKGRRANFNKASRKQEAIGHVQNNVGAAECRRKVLVLTGFRSTRVCSRDGSGVRRTKNTSVRSSTGSSNTRLNQNDYACNLYVHVHTPPHLLGVDGKPLDWNILRL